MFYVREVLGWVLMVLGLWLFYQSYVFVVNKNYVGSGPTLIMGIVVFRGGIHLLKVAVAAKVCRQAPAEARLPAVRPQPVRPQRRATVVPGRG